TGINNDWGPPVSLHLKNEGHKRITVEKDAIRFTSGSILLNGILLKPAGINRFPVVVLVPGSGAQGVATTMYRSLGYILADHGIGAVIYDKRGVGGSEGNFEEATFSELADDALAAIHFIKR